MKKLYFLAAIISISSCKGLTVNNNDANPVPVHVVGDAAGKPGSAQNVQSNFRAMGAGENSYAVKPVGNKTTIQFLFVSCKPFSDAPSHEVDFVIKDANGLVIFTTPLPLDNETFSQMVMFNVNSNESCELTSTTDRFTFWASGYNETGK